MSHDCLFKPKREPRVSWWLGRGREGFTEVAKRECRPIVTAYNNWERSET